MAGTAIDSLLAGRISQLHEAEKQLTKVLPKMASAATDDELAEVFRAHVHRTACRVKCLAGILDLLGTKLKPKAVGALARLIVEGEGVVSETFRYPFKDIALIAAARRIELFQLGSYDGVLPNEETRLHANAKRSVKVRAEIAALLERTVKEETEADGKLACIAERLISQLRMPKVREETEPAPAQRMSTSLSKRGSARAAIASDLR